MEEEAIPPDPESPESKDPPCPFVLIGASAGGLQAFESFLSELPAGFCFAVVYIQHLPPDHKSLMPELLRARRPDLEVEEMADGQQLLPGHIYLYPPDKEVRILQGRIAEIPVADRPKHLPIDDFFISLSEYAAERIIAVILSGAGTDGARGVKAIKAAGGTVFVQDPVTAEFQSMPLSAIGTGQIDGVLPPNEIARKILSIVQCGASPGIAGELITPEQFDPLFRVVYDKTGLRFPHYKKSVLERRVRRRMQLQGVDSMAGYLEMLAASGVEAEMLAADFLIGVTSFFRDRIAWTALQSDVVTPLLEKNHDSPIRIWIPACATGEEVYSVAMMFRAALDSSGRKKDLQIFASDVNEYYLEKARGALYPESAAADIPPDYLAKFVKYTPDGLALHIDSKIRENLVFAKHDLMTDPPFSRMDLIVCRNLLIYLEPYAQDKCISLFSYALNEGGYLFLGSAESPGSNSALFKAVGNKKYRIYRKVSPGSPVNKPTPSPLFYKQPPFTQTKAAAILQPRFTAADLAQKALVSRFAPAAVAITSDYEIVYYNGPTNIFLKQPEGPPTQNLIDLLPENLRSRFRGGLYKVIHENKPVVIRSKITDEKGMNRQVTINISAVSESLFLVTFSAKGTSARAEETTLEISHLDETSLRQLENELCATREDLQNHIEQLESLSEELQSSNEELQASNEELETSKEELQSLNEELLTVNAQLQNKIEELDETNDDLVNFISSTDIPTLFLDKNLHVKRFTPALEKLITLIPADVGRSITDMAQNNLGPDLIADATTVIEDHITLRAEVRIGDNWYMRTMLPYRTVTDRIDGAVITYNDVTEIKNAQERSEFLASFPQINPNPVLQVSPSGEVVFANPAALKVIKESGLTDDKASLFLPSDFQALVKNLSKGIELTDYREVSIGNRVFGETVHLLPHFNVARIYAYDITERKQAQETILNSETRYRELVQNANSAIIRWRADGAITFFNEYAESFFGYKSDEVVGRHVGMLLPKKESGGGDPSGLIQDILDHPERYENHVNENICSDGRRVWMAWTNKPILGPDGRLSEVLAVGTDMTELRRVEREREFISDFLQLLNKSLDSDGLIRSAVTYFKQQTGCDAVGIRIQDDGDYPYYEVSGFSENFVRAENSLCSRDANGEIIRDTAGNPVLECMCGNVIRGRFDPSKPFFTENGSFWTNSTSELLASTSEADRQSRTRNRCNGEGYESVALIPLKTGDVRLGLLQLNDRRKDIFTRTTIAVWERLSGYLAVALAKFRTEKMLFESEALYHSLFDNMLNGFAYCRMIFEEGRPADFIYLAVNDSFSRLTGLKDVTGKRVTEVIPGIRQSDPALFDIYGKVASSGVPTKLEVYVEALKLWFEISVYSPKADHFVAVFDVVSERKRAEEELRESRERIRLILNSTAEGIYGLDLEGMCTFCNPSGVSMLGYGSEDDLIGRDMHELIHHTRANGTPFPKGECFSKIALTSGERLHRDREILWRADGSCFPTEYWTHPIFKDGALVGAVVTFVDISERIALENQLAQAQKMEAIGQLAGGIAHDFNNLLTAIIGHGNLLQSKIPDSDPLADDVEQILESADKAAEVTRSLLAFSRQEIMSIRPVNINELVLKFEKLLGRIIGEEIEVRASIAPGDIFTMADSIRIEQVLMNLATNARDAMPHGGTLTIQTEKTELAEMSLPSLGPVVPGPYVVMSVSDTGDGISPDALSKIFEPFYTTKELGKGTGLGLSMVYGIIKQHGGYINVDTSPGIGTTFKVYLPVAVAENEEAARPSADSRPEGGTETILIAEDDEKLRRLFGVVLAKYGYQTIFAANGDEAISAFARNKDKVDLALMDIIMPKKSGMEAYAEIKKIRPDIKVIFLSGYTADRLDAGILNNDGVHLILKPVSPADLLRRVREVLEK